MGDSTRSRSLRTQCLFDGPSFFDISNANDHKTPVSMSIPFILQDPSIFADPHTFDPERWIRSAEQGENLERFQITFAKGSRSCPGQK